jgi:hypothetical protein
MTDPPEQSNPPSPPVGDPDYACNQSANREPPPTSKPRRKEVARTDQLFHGKAA